MKTNRLGFTEEEQIKINVLSSHYGLVNYSKKLNKVVIQGIEGYYHFMAKSKLCYFLKQKKIPFVTEFPIGKNIPDILVLKPLFGIEILNTETEKQFQAKVDKSPDGLLLIKIGCKHVIEEMNNIDEII